MWFLLGRGGQLCAVSETWSHEWNGQRALQVVPMVWAVGLCVGVLTMPPDLACKRTAKKCGDVCVVC